MPGGLRFSWDPAKSALNLKKHGVGFSEAQTVFQDEGARLIDDPDHSYNEDRFIILGMSSKHRMLLVCHCYREGDDEIRIISARKTTNREMNKYKEY